MYDSDDRVYDSYDRVYLLPSFVPRIPRPELLVHGGSDGALGPLPLAQSAITGHFGDNRCCTHLHDMTKQDKTRQNKADRETGGWVRQRLW